MSRRLASFGGGRPTWWGWLVIALLPIGLASWLVYGASVGSGSLLIVFSRNSVPYPVPPAEAGRLTLVLFGRNWLPPKGESISRTAWRLVSGQVTRPLSAGQAIVTRPGLLSFAIKYDDVVIYRGQGTISLNSTTTCRVALEDTLRTLIVSNLPAQSTLTDRVAGTKLTGRSYALTNLKLGEGLRLLLEVPGYRPLPMEVLPSDLSPLLVFTNLPLIEPSVVLHCSSATRSPNPLLDELAARAEWTVASGPGESWRGRTNMAGQPVGLKAGGYWLLVWHKDFEPTKVFAQVDTINASNQIAVPLVPLPARLRIESTPSVSLSKVRQGKSDLPVEDTNVVVLTPVRHELEICFGDEYESVKLTNEPAPNTRGVYRCALVKAGAVEFASLSNRLQSLLQPSERQALNALGGRDWELLGTDLTNALDQGLDAPRAAIPALTNIEPRLVALISLVAQRQRLDADVFAAAAGHSVSNYAAAFKHVAEYEAYLGTQGKDAVNDADVARLKAALAPAVVALAREQIDSLLAKTNFAAAVLWLDSLPQSLCVCLGQGGIAPMKARVKAARAEFEAGVKVARAEFEADQSRSQIEEALRLHDYPAAISTLADSKVKFPEKAAQWAQLAARLAADRRLFYAKRLRNTCGSGRLEPQVVSAILLDLAASGGSVDKRLLEAFLISELLVRHLAGAAVDAVSLFQKDGAACPWTQSEMEELKELIKRYGEKADLSPQDRKAVELLRDSLN